MTTTTGTRRGNTAERALRLVLGVDAAASLLVGAVPALLAGPLSDDLGLPIALLRGLGVLVVWAAALAWIATRRPLARPAVGAVVAANAVWAAAGLVAAVEGWGHPTAGGRAVIAVQAVATVVLASLEYRGLRRLASA